MKMQTLAGLAAVALLSSTAALAADQLSEAQIAAAMKKADPDNDGTVSKAEAHKFGITREAFQNADPDNDGTLDAKEFAAAVSWQFAHANHDKDGTLDKKEAAGAGVKAAAFDAADTDKDGTLDLGEYLDALTNAAK